MSDATSRRAVILYGPPASGKSTITRCLEHIDGRYGLFPRLKAGGGRAAEYRIVTREYIEGLRIAGDIVWANERYGAMYAIDRSYLLNLVEAGRIPVLHLGQRCAVDAVRSAIPDVRVTTISLTYPRSLAVQRIADRATGDDADRIAAFDTTDRLVNADLVIDTSAVTPIEAAQLISGRILT